VSDGAAGADGPPLSSRIIRAANAFDDLVGSSVESSRAVAAVERLRLDTAAEYDPRVVDALGRLINRRSVVGGAL
jgi:HD-GYP domain-containing protein (c-di-GMP phosphodiesterase class II)